MTDQFPGDVEAALDFAKANIHPGKINSEDSVDKPHLITIPEGHRVEELTHHYDQFRDVPRRLTGTADFTEAESFTQHVERFKDEHSAIFAHRDETEPRLTAVYDYHQEHGKPRFANHRAAYKFPLSEEWEAWRGQDKTKMGQGEFATFIEMRLGDVVAPAAANDETEPAKEARALAKQTRLAIASPSKLMDLSRGLQVSVNTEITNAAVLQSGEAEIHFKSEHAPKVKVPGLFFIGIPVFEGGAPYQMAVLLRYRVSQSVEWWFEIYRPDLTFRAAFDDVVETVKEETKLPVWFGAPE